MGYGVGMGRMGRPHGDGPAGPPQRKRGAEAEAEAEAAPEQVIGFGFDLLERNPQPRSQHGD
jgi:hypothetical protein